MKSVIVIIFDKPSNSSLLFTCINDDVNYRLMLCSCAHALIILWTWGFCATAERRGLCHRKNRLLVTRFRDDYTSTKSCAEVWSLNDDCDFNHDDFIFQFWWSTIFFQWRVGADTTLSWSDDASGILPHSVMDFIYLQRDCMTIRYRS